MTPIATSWTISTFILHPSITTSGWVHSFSAHIIPQTNWPLSCYVRPANKSFPPVHTYLSNPLSDGHERTNAVGHIVFPLFLAVIVATGKWSNSAVYPALRLGWCSTEWWGCEDWGAILGVFCKYHRKAECSPIFTILISTIKKALGCLPGFC
jgi:hypothetical protein